jgi:Glycosyl hydrolases family 38 N-terminal domain
MKVNFYYIGKYPHYVFNWTGSNRYRLMKEYYPADYARMKQYIAMGNWFPAGSSVEEGDLNLSSAESIIRQILYGNSYFRKEFGKASDEAYIPHLEPVDFRALAILCVDLREDRKEAQDLLLDGTEGVGKTLHLMAVVGKQELSGR